MAEDYSKMNYEQLKKTAGELLKIEQDKIAALRENKTLSDKQLETLIKQNEELQENAAKRRAVARLLKAEKERTKLITDDLIRQEESLKTISAELQPLIALDRQRLELQRAHVSVSTETANTFNNIADLSKQLAALTSEDAVGRAVLQDQIQKELDSLEGVSGTELDIKNLLQAQFDLARNYSQLSEEQHELLKAQVESYKEIKKTIGGILGTAGLLFSGLRGAARIGLMGAGKAITEIGKATREMGGYLGGATVGASALGLVFDDAVDTAKQLGKELGGLGDVTFQAQLNTNLMATNMGITGQEAAQLTGNFARLNGGSIETAQNLAASTKELAKQNGLVPSQVMADVAASAEQFAAYGKQGGLNMAKAAVSAGKLGVTMDSMTKVTDSLLDFESSINQEMELGAMLGRNLNLDRARGLAYEGDITGAVAATLDELGGIEEFNKMDIFQKRKAAELLGLSVDEFQKMAANSDKLSENGQMQISAFDSMSESFTAITTGPLGNFVTGLSGAIGTTSEIAGNFKSAGGFLSDMGGKLKTMFGGKKPELPGTDKSITSTAPKPTTAPQTQAGPADQANKMSKINTKALVQGAFALLILAAALFVAAKAFQEFGDVTWPAVGMGLAALAGMAAIAFVLSKIKGQMIEGALAIAILGAALIPFAYSLNIMSNVNSDGLIAAGIALVGFTAGVFALGAILSSGVGTALFGAGITGLVLLGGALIVLGAGLALVGSGMSAITGALPAMVEQISALSNIQFLPILGLAGALTVLSIALLAVASAGLLALPALLALGLVAGGAAAVFGGGEEGGEADKTDLLIEEIKGLRADLNAGKIAVHMDGQKVTSRVSSVVDKIGSNSYAKV